MLLSEILKTVKYSCKCFEDREISDIVYDSRKAGPGVIFTALPGAFTDGHDYVYSAYVKGAKVFLLQKELPLPSDAVVIRVDDSRAALSQISAEFFRHPDRELDVIGVTGTKGKTTVTHILRTCLCKCGIKSGVIGTMGAYYGDKYIPTLNTTPESYELYKLLREMADEGCRAACIEVSSLGLKGHRVDGIRFKAAVFTNLSPDHIGGAEHESFSEYSYWKKQLFKRCEKAFLNADDLFSGQIAKECSAEIKSFAINLEADIKAGDIKKLRACNFFGVEFNCFIDGKSYKMRSAMPGFFSVYNALAAIGVCRMYGIEPEKISKALENAVVKGRNECVHVPADFDVIIDYAHNGQSFNSLINTFSEYPHGRIITVFGSVGDRAQLRREEMGLISGAKAQLSVITSDDPAFENPEKIAMEIAGFVEKAGGKYKIIIDRREAVFYALDKAEKDDIVLILGKGHEIYQKIGGERLHYSDHESVEQYFAAKNKNEIHL